MKTLEIIGFERANLGKKESNEIRFSGSIPCVMYGGTEVLHFHAPAFLFNDLVYSEAPAFVALTVAGKSYTCKLQEVQFHPVSEMILHVDFFELNQAKEIVMNIPVVFEGNSPGAAKGGKLNLKLRKIKVKGLPANMPDVIKIDISSLDLGKSAKVGDIKAGNYTILNPKAVPVVTVEVPRALKGAVAEEGKK